MEYRGYRYEPWIDEEPGECRKVFHEAYGPDSKRVDIDNSDIVPAGMTYVSAYSELTEAQFQSWVDQFLALEVA